jgi:cytochrome oxidase Cu insertion factor (SCO1/SenC/PrrC family)
MPDRSTVQRRLRFALLPVCVGTAIGLGAALTHGGGSTAASSPPRPLDAQITWAAGKKPAPLFTLRDEHGARLSFRALRGHPILLTFLDSVCKRECPVEGRELAGVERAIAPSGAIVAVVGVDPWSETATTVLRFTRRMGWTGRWHWFLGPYRSLRPVWKSYAVAVRRVPGDVAHSVVAYVIDKHGDLRAGYLFPFRAAAVVRDIRTLAAANGA